MTWFFNIKLFYKKELTNPSSCINNIECISSIAPLVHKWRQMGSYSRRLESTQKTKDAKYSMILNMKVSYSNIALRDEPKKKNGMYDIR